MQERQEAAGPWAMARRIGATLIARYDSRALRPPVTPDSATAHGLALSPHQEEVQRWVLAWCRQGIGEQPFALAVLASPPGIGTAALVEDLALRLDGTWLMLAAGGRWAQRLMRLRVKWDECSWWRSRGAEAPWDSGYLGDQPAALARLVRFEPRRPTLMVAPGLADASLRQAVQALSARQAAFAHPVRLLVVDTTLSAALAHWPVEGAAVSRSGRVCFHRLREP
ncbi:hypothetical protein HLB44_32730 [Aquincola sp. S2]|uniref:Uncharacterized protein n=1 Tax=Pseudaquabacterium terrae TaxID=2732868 RepID=A0ABX2ESX3_9BURK|nr:hypothetical protein [Aquabacterium terrae]NRF71761.1 hypothetical protein [Aquabacterium terrae]